MNRPKRTRRDLDQKRIVRDLSQLGAYVWDLADVGGEILDLLVFWRGRARPVEVKRPGHERDLTDGEREGIERLALAGCDAIIATSAEDVVRAWGDDD